MDSPKIKPQCLTKKKGRDHAKIFGHTAKGWVLPCCWCDVVNPDKDPEIKKLMSEKLLLKNNNKIEDIIDSEEWKRFYNTITIPSLYEQAPEVCKRKCKS